MKANFLFEVFCLNLVSSKLYIHANTIFYKMKYDLKVIEGH